MNKSQLINAIEKIESVKLNYGSKSVKTIHNIRRAKL